MAYSLEVMKMVIMEEIEVSGEFEIMVEEISQNFVGKGPAISALSNSKSKQWRDDDLLETSVRRHPAP